MADLYKAKALVVKVSVGPENGNTVARILSAGDIVPEGVAQDKLDALVARGLIEKVKQPSTASTASTAAAAKKAADAKAKADADEASKKAAEEAKAKADADEAAKQAAAGK